MIVIIELKKIIRNYFKKCPINGYPYEICY